MNNKIITYLCLSAYRAYTLSFSGTPEALRIFEFCKNIAPGHLVMESSSFWKRDLDPIRIGTLESIAREPFHSDKEWEEIKGGCGERPTETVYYIRALSDGELKRWTNASFIRVIDDHEWLKTP